MGADERAALKNNHMGMRKVDQSHFLFLLFFRIYDLVGKARTMKRAREVESALDKIGAK